MAIVVCVAAVVTLAAMGAIEPEARAVPARVASPESQLAVLLGFADGKLVRIEPETLRPVARPSVAVGSGGCAPRQGGTACWTSPAWAASPNGARVAIARNDTSTVRLVDVRRMRVAAAVRWGFGGGSIGALAWLAPARVLAVQEAFGDRQRLAVFDLARKRVVATRALGGAVLHVGRAAKALVLLVGPEASIGPTRIAVADARGTVRSAPLDRIVAGSQVLGTGSEHAVDLRSPGLAVDPLGRRAYVVDASQVAEVDLRTLEVSYHALARPPSLLTRLRNWLEPVASAKQVSGYHRHAEWLGAGSIAVSGSDAEGGRYQPAGMHLVDTPSWTLRDLDGHATGFELAEGLLLATGSRWDETRQLDVGTGITAYSVDGAKRFQLFPGEHAWLAQVYRGRAYVGVASAQDRLRIVELASGTVTGLREPTIPTLLLGAGSGWWG